MFLLGKNDKVAYYTLKALKYSQYSMELNCIYDKNKKQMVKCQGWQVKCIKIRKMGGKKGIRFHSFFRCVQFSLTVYIQKYNQAQGFWYKVNSFMNQLLHTPRYSFNNRMNNIFLFSYKKENINGKYYMHATWLSY